MHILLESITVGFVLDAKTESNTCRGDRFCRLCPQRWNNLDILSWTLRVPVVSPFSFPGFQNPAKWILSGFQDDWTDSNSLFSGNPPRLSASALFQSAQISRLLSNQNVRNFSAGIVDYRQSAIRRPFYRKKGARVLKRYGVSLDRCELVRQRILGTLEVISYAFQFLESSLLVLDLSKKVGYD